MTALNAMAQAAATAVGEVTGTQVHVGQVVPVSPTEAIGAPGMMINRSQLAPDGGHLVTLVPAAGFVSAEAALDASQLTSALVAGATNGLAGAGGPLLQPMPPELVPTAAALDLNGTEAYAFDLVSGSKSITIIWVVEATLGSLVGGSIPVDESPAQGPTVASATLSDLGRAGTVAGNRDMSVLSDVSARVSVEIARGTALVRDLVGMSPGSVFELDREAGDAVDILVNGAMIARGDIVVVGHQLGVRITKVCEPQQ